MCVRRGIRRLSESSAHATLLAGLLLAGGTGATAAQGIDVARASEFFAEADVLGRQGVPLWGVALNGPMLLVDADTREAVGNVADTLGVLRPNGGVWVGQLPADVGVANTAVEWAGRRWTMLVWPLPYGRLSRWRLMAHEMFHRVQPELGIPSRDATNAHLDSDGGRLLLRLEWRALQLALADSGAARRAAIADAVRFRARRHEQFPAGALEERQLELNEGLAEYTGIRIAVPVNARAGWTAAQIENYDVRAMSSSVGRSFAYATGPAYGVLLDAADPDWRTRVSPETELSRLLARAHDIPWEGGSELSTHWEKYDGVRLAEEERGRAREIAERNARMKARFVDGPTLTVPATATVRYTFNPGEVVPYGDAGTVYLTTEVRDTWGLLRVTMDGALLVREAGRIARVVVPAPSDITAEPLRGPGWTLELVEGWVVVPGARPGDFVLQSR
jgi:hypothetical protein